VSHSSHLSPLSHFVLLRSICYEYSRTESAAAPPSRPFTESRRAGTARIRERRKTESVAPEVASYGWKTVGRVRAKPRSAEKPVASKHKYRFPIHIRGNRRGSTHLRATMLAPSYRPRHPHPGCRRVLRPVPARAGYLPDRPAAHSLQATGRSAAYSLRASGRAADRGVEKPS
jgi:hypothetical protein